MPQMGVSVAEGTVVEWKKQVGDWVEADEIIASISTDKIDTDVESPATGRVAEIVVRRRRDRRRRHRDGADRHRREARRGARVRERRRGTGEAAAALEAPGEAGELHDRRRAPNGHGATRPWSCGSPPSTTSTSTQVEGTGRGGRVRKQDVLAFVERRRRKSRRCTSRARTGPTSPPRRSSASRACSASTRCRARPPRRPRRRPAGGQPLSPHAPGDRLADGAVAADRGDLHDDRRGRHDPHRGRAQGRPGSATCPTRPARRSRRCSSSRRSTPRSRTTSTPSTPTPCTSASPSARRRRPDRPGHPRRAGPQRRGPGQAHQGPRRARAREPAQARRGQRRHVHDHQPRRATARSWPRR